MKDGQNVKGKKKNIGACADRAADNDLLGCDQATRYHLPCFIPIYPFNAESVCPVIEYTGNTVGLKESTPLLPNIHEADNQFDDEFTITLPKTHANKKPSTSLICEAANPSVLSNLLVTSSNDMMKLGLKSVKILQTGDKVNINPFDFK